MNDRASIDVSELADWRQSGAAHVLLDVREPWEIDVAGLPGALAIPMQEIPNRLAEIPKSGPLVVMCHHGGRSQQVTNWLRAQGYDNALNLTGGIDAWSREVDGATPRY
jgi:rhodanese-related sulfurtransferase